MGRLLGGGDPPTSLVGVAVLRWSRARGGGGSVVHAGARQPRRRRPRYRRRAPPTAKPGVVPRRRHAPDAHRRTGWPRRWRPVVADPNLGQAGRPDHRRHHRQRSFGQQGDDVPMQPASTNKVLTAAAALPTLDRRRPVTHTVVAGGPERAPGMVVLVGGGDPTLSAAPPDSPTWYRDAAADQRPCRPGSPQRRHAVPRSRWTPRAYSGPTMAPGLGPADIDNGDIAPMRVGDARRRPHPADHRRLLAVRTPALDAGRALADGPERRPRGGDDLPRPGGRQAARRRCSRRRWCSGCSEMMNHSDNVMAECDRAAKWRRRSTGPRELRRRGRRGYRPAEHRAGVDTAGAALLDSSGLSVDDRLTATTLDGVVKRPRAGPAEAAAAAGPAADRRRQRNAVDRFLDTDDEQGGRRACCAPRRGR